MDINGVLTMSRAKKRSDNQLRDYNPLMLFCKIKENEALYKRQSPISHCQLDLLAVLVNRYIYEGSGSTCNWLATRLNPSSSAELRSVNYKVNRLMQYGYIEVMSRTGRFTYYIPTQKALEELSELCK